MDPAPEVLEGEQFGWAQARGRPRAQQPDHRHPHPQDAGF